MNAQERAGVRHMIVAWSLLASVIAVEAAALCAVIALAGAAWWWGLVPVGVSLAGAAAVARNSGLSPREIRDEVLLTEDDDPRLFAITARLCALAGRDMPELRLFDHRRANALAYTPPGGRPAVYVTIALLERLDDRRLEAVIAHELAHLDHRDQQVLVFAEAITGWMIHLPALLFMSAGLADLWLCGAARRCGRRWAPAMESHRARELDERYPEPTVPPRWRTPALVGVGLVRAVVLATAGLVVLPMLFAGLAQFAVAWLLRTAAVGVLIRRRELAADRAAAALTGTPSVLAAALLDLTGRSVSPPTRDLRAPEVASALAIVPFADRRARDGWGRLVLRLRATHPPVARRVAALQRMARAAGRGER